MERFREFSPIGKKEWLEKIEKDLKGKPLADLTWQLGENFQVDPFAHGDDLDYTPVALTGNRRSNDWEIGEVIVVRNTDDANRLLLDGLEKGVQAPLLLLRKILSDTDLNALLDQVEPAYISLHFGGLSGADAWKEQLNQWQIYLKKRAIEPATIQCSFHAGTDLLPQIADFPDSWIGLTVDGKELYDGPGNASAELAALLKRSLTFLDAKLPAERIFDGLQFSVSVGTSYFVEIAKLRALHLLWAQMQKIYDADEIRLPRIEAHLAGASLTDDPHTNMIRSTTQAMSAVIGGARRLYLPPANVPAAAPDAFHRRIARNVQHILKMESYLDRVIDPAAGSYYIERLTDQLAGQAWKLFQDS